MSCRAGESAQRGARQHPRAFRGIRAVVSCTLILLLGVHPAGAQAAPSGNIRWPQTDVGQPPRTLSFLGSPTISLGTAAGPDVANFSGIIGATRLASGAIVVGDASSARVLYFNQAGHFVRSFGRLGDGPGEFRMPRWLGLCGSNVGIYDAATASLTLLSEDGALLGRSRLPPNLNFAAPIKCARAESFTLLLNRIQVRVGPGQHLRIPTAVARVVGMDRLDTLYRGGIQEYYVGQSGQAYSDVPLGRATLSTSGRTLLFVAENFSDTVSVFTQEGALVRRLRLGLSRPRMTRLHWERAVEARVVAEPLERTRILLRSVLRELPAPEVLPMIHQVVADAADNLWVRTYHDLSTQYSLWLVFSPEGAPIARVVLPRQLRVLEIGIDHLLAVSKDEDDVESVLLFRFRQLSTR